MMIGKIIGLCAFISFLSFKPSEPYLSQYLICNLKMAESVCKELDKDQQGCKSAATCSWANSTSTATASLCTPRACSSYPIEATSVDPACTAVSYCMRDSESGGACSPQACYKDFSESAVNNKIYPYSTFFYLPALLLLCPLAELYSYRLAILVGILGRVVTRFLLLFGTSLGAMQLMQVSYAVGTAAEDIFYAYVFYAVPKDLFQVAMSSCRTSALVSSLVASILGDVLVVFGTPLTTLQWISAVCVCSGAALGVLIIQPSAKTQMYLENRFPAIAAMVVSEVVGKKEAGNFADPIPSPLAGRESEGNRQSQGQSKDVISEASSGASAAEVRALKLRVFVSQILFFYSTVRASPNLTMQVLYWIVCNATFAEIFGYEVAIFQQLNGGNNKWNGSVLSVMLLLGAIGAMLPVFLKVDAPGRYNYLEVNRLISLGASFGSLFLLLFVYIWQIAASLAMLSLYLLCWQFISVIVLVQVATELKIGHDRAERQREEESAAREGVEGGGPSGPSPLPSPSPSVSSDSVLLIQGQGSSSSSSSDGGGSGSGGSSGAHSDSHGTGYSSGSNSDGGGRVRRGSAGILVITGVGGVAQASAATPAASPSYAIAIVSLVAISVVLQSIEVIITFSAMQLSLQKSLMLPVYMFVISSFIFVVYSLGREISTSRASL